MHSKEQRLAHYNLCTILFLTSDDPADRNAAKKLRELFRKNTLTANNQCEFDKSPSQKSSEAFDSRYLKKHEAK